MAFDREQFGRTEIELGLQLLKIDPHDQKQKDRVAYWAIKLNEPKLAKKYSTSTKMKAMYQTWVKDNTK